MGSLSLLANPSVGCDHAGKKNIKKHNQGDAAAVVVVDPVVIAVVAAAAAAAAEAQAGAVALVRDCRLLVVLGGS